MSGSPRQWEIGDRVSWLGGTEFGKRTVRWTGTVVGLGYGTPSGYVQTEGGEMREVFPRRPSARVLPDVPQHDKSTHDPHDAPVIVPLDELSRPGWTVGERAFWRGSGFPMPPPDGVMACFATVITRVLSAAEMRMFKDFEVTITAVRDGTDASGAPFVYPCAAVADDGFVFDPSIDIARLERLT